MKKSIIETLIIEHIERNLGVTKAKAKKLYANALMFNVVREEITNQARFLYENKCELL